MPAIHWMPAPSSSWRSMAFQSWSRNWGSRWRRSAARVGRVRFASPTTRLCADAGGSVTGEHGIGLEKRENIRYIFSDDDLEVMDRIRHVLDPHGLMNPGKVFPGEVVEGSAPSRAPDHAPRRAANVAGGDE